VNLLVIFTEIDVDFEFYLLDASLQVPSLEFHFLIYTYKTGYYVHNSEANTSTSNIL
jgi:hypothetical protein